MTYSDPPSRLDAVVRIPGSKSITHRAIIAASLAEGRSVLTDFLKCEDTLYTLNALRQLGKRLHGIRHEVGMADRSEQATRNA